MLAALAMKGMLNVYLKRGVLMAIILIQIFVLLGQELVIHCGTGMIDLVQIIQMLR